MRQRQLMLLASGSRMARTGKRMSWKNSGRTRAGWLLLAMIVAAAGVYAICSYRGQNSGKPAENVEIASARIDASYLLATCCGKGKFPPQGSSQRAWAEAAGAWRSG